MQGYIQSPAKNNYQLWLDAGNTGTMEDYLNSLIGEGVPSGGTGDQLLAKNSNADYDTKWVNPPNYHPSEKTAAMTQEVGVSAEGKLYTAPPNIPVQSVNNKIGAVQLTAADVDAVPTTRKVNNKALSQDITLSYTDVGAVPTSRTINNKALSNNVTLTPMDIGAVKTVNGVASDSSTGNLLLYKDQILLRSNDVHHAGLHNSIYRGKNLGNSVTSAQWAAIKAGTFEDLYIGDYWEINGVKWRIAAFNYYYNTGDTNWASTGNITTNHVTIVPDTNLYSAQMNTTNTTSGGYYGSAMRGGNASSSNLDTAKTTINSAFGVDHILNHRQILTNAVTNEYASGYIWTDSTVELMTEQNVYGGKIYGNVLNGTNFPTLYTIDKSQYPLFAFRPDMIDNRAWFWLRDVVSAVYFALVTSYGGCTCYGASTSAGVRPAFSIYQS